MKNRIWFASYEQLVDEAGKVDYVYLTDSREVTHWGDLCADILFEQGTDKPEREGFVYYCMIDEYIPLDEITDGIYIPCDEYEKRRAELEEEENKEGK